MAETSQLAKRPNPLAPVGSIDTLRSYIDAKGMQMEIRKALPEGWTPEKFGQAVMMAARREPRILDCTARSVIGSIMEAAQLGFEPDPTLGHCALVPMKIHETLTCCMWPMYRGYISLAMRTGQVASFFAKVVRKGEEFQVMYGTSYQIHHIPKFPQSVDVKDWVGAYSVIIYKDGTRDFEYMDREAILAIEKRSPSKRSGRPSPWDTDPEPMWCKTIMRKHAKRIDLSPMDRRLQKIAALDEYREAGVPMEKVGLGIDDYVPAQQPSEAALPEAQRKSETPDAKPEAEKNTKQDTRDSGKAGKDTRRADAKAKPGAAGRGQAAPKQEPVAQKQKIAPKQISDLLNAAANAAGGGYDNWNPWVRKLVKKRGFDKVEDITVDRYADILAEIKAGGYQD